MSVPDPLAPVSSSPSLLIVDDFADALDVWEIYLRTEGFKVTTALDGPTAFAEALREKPDVIVMDLELPGKSGLEIARDLKAHPDTCAIPLIAATGHSQPATHALARTSGFESVLVKPIEPHLLVEEIRRLLRRPHDNPQNAGEQEPSIVR
jgi:DNA-binding response OmpR family regulator